MIKIMPTFAAEFLLSSKKKEQKKMEKLKKEDPYSYFVVQQEEIDKLTAELFKRGEEVINYGKLEIHKELH